MTDRIKTWMPQNVESPVHVFRGFTVRDLARVGLPAAVGLAGGGLPGAVLGAGVGGAVYGIRPKGDPVDVHAHNAARHVLGIHTGSWPAIDRVENGVAVLDNGDVLGIVRVASVDMAMRPDWEQRALQDTVADLYASAEYPVEIYSIQQDQPLDRYRTEQDAAVTTLHFAVIRSSAGGVTGSVDDAVQEVRDRCSEVSDVLSGTDFAATQVTGDQLDAVLTELRFGEITVTPRTFTEQHDTVFRGLMVTGWPREVQTAWLADVLNVDGKVWAVQRVEPETPDTLSRIRDRIIAEQAVTGDPSRGSTLERYHEDLTRIEDRDIEGDRPVRYDVFIAAYGPDDATVNGTVRRVKNVLRRHRIEFREPLLRMHQAAKTASLRHRTQVGTQQVATSWGAAGAFPFAASDMIEDGGVVFGRSEPFDRSRQRRMLVVLDRFAWSAPHMAVLGKTGAGKTFWMQLLLLRSAERYDNLQVLLLDLKPDPEYGSIAETLECAVDRWAIGEEIKDEPGLLSEVLRHVYDAARQHSGPSIVVVDEAHKVLHDEPARRELADLVQMGRSEDIAVTPMTQSASHFLQHGEEGKAILRQMDCHVLFRQEDVETGVEQFFNLSDRERIQLRKLRTGTDGFSEAVVRGPVQTGIRIEPVGDEATIITGGEDG